MNGDTLTHMAVRIILGIESSCDETSAAIVSIDGDQLRVLSCRTAGQDDLHAEYRGVVPEIASRAHLDRIIPVVRGACAEAGITLKEINGVAAGNRPGLIGSLLVGTSTAKALAWSLDIPFVGVDHVIAHLVAGLLDQPPLQWPAIGLVASGGHTSLFLMRSPMEVQLIGATIDDAAGEAFEGEEGPPPPLAPLPLALACCAPLPRRRLLFVVFPEQEEEEEPDPGAAPQPPFSSFSALAAFAAAPVPLPRLPPPPTSTVCP